MLFYNFLLDLFSFIIFKLNSIVIPFILELAILYHFSFKQQKKTNRKRVSVCPDGRQKQTSLNGVRFVLSLTVPRGDPRYPSVL